MSIASRHDLAEATATVIAFGHCGKILEGMPSPVVRSQLAELLDLVNRAESAIVDYDGFGSGGYGETRGSDDPERLTPLEQHMENLTACKRCDHAEQHHRSACFLCDCRTFVSNATPADDVYDLASSATDDLVEAGRRLRAMAHKLELARQHAKPRRPNAHTEETCAEPFCEDPVTRRKQSGRCDACYEYRRAWTAEHPGEVAPPVPERIIANRKNRETRRRQHITGPLADTA